MFECSRYLTLSSPLKLYSFWGKKPKAAIRVNLTSHQYLFGWQLQFVISYLECSTTAEVQVMCVRMSSSQKDAIFINFPSIFSKQIHAVANIQWHVMACESSMQGRGSKSEESPFFGEAPCAPAKQSPAHFRGVRVSSSCRVRWLASALYIGVLIT